MHPAKLYIPPCTFHHPMWCIMQLCNIPPIHTFRQAKEDKTSFHPMRAKRNLITFHYQGHPSIRQKASIIQKEESPFSPYPRKSPTL